MKSKLSFFILVFFVSTQVYAQISYLQFQSIVSVFHQVYDTELQKQNATLVINSGATEESKDIWWNMPNRHASYSSYIEENGNRIHYLFMFGGYAQISQMTIEGVAMTLCHELGHGIGGEPVKDKSDEPPASVEGQSDFFAARFCIKRILRYLALNVPIKALSSWVDRQCAKNFSDTNQKQLCLRSFQVLEMERLFFRTQEGIETETYYDKPDLSVTDKINLDPYFYPSAQCRLDTMVAGVLEKNRPRCWFSP